jgi:hypothetical protein
MTQVMSFEVLGQRLYYCFFYAFFVDIIVFCKNIAIFATDYGVTVALRRRLVKGNPV